MYEHPRLKLQSCQDGLGPALQNNSYCSTSVELEFVLKVKEVIYTESVLLKSV